MIAARKLLIALPMLLALFVLRPAAADDRVPFKERGEGQVYFNPLTGGGPFTASGVATHLGHFTAEGTVQFLPTLPNGLTPGFGEITFTAANGDELHATFEGVIDLSTGFAVSDYTLNGGTGRFHDASGQFVVYNILFPDFSFLTIGEGWISRPNQ